MIVFIRQRGVADREFDLCQHNMKKTILPNRYMTSYDLQSSLSFLNKRSESEFLGTETCKNTKQDKHLEE